MCDDGLCRCQQQTLPGRLRFYAWNHTVPAQQILLAKSSRRAAQVQAEGTVQGVATGKNGVLGPHVRGPHEPYILLKGKW